MIARPVGPPCSAPRGTGATPRVPRGADRVALTLAAVLGLATLSTLFRFFQFVAWA